MTLLVIPPYRPPPRPPRWRETARTAALVALLLFGAAFVLGFLTACRPETIFLPGGIDTLFVDRPSAPRVDTLIVRRVDTVTTTRTDTVVRVRVDTVPTTSPPIVVIHYDTSVVFVPVTVYVPRTDTLYLPGAIVYDTTWVYLQTNPTNPIGDGDYAAGLAYLDLPNDWGAIVFWHGHFMGVVQQRPADGRWSAFWYQRDSLAMPLRGTFDTKLEAIYALTPITLVLTPADTTPPPSTAPP